MPRASGACRSDENDQKRTQTGVKSCSAAVPSVHSHRAYLPQRPSQSNQNIRGRLRQRANSFPSAMKIGGVRHVNSICIC